MLRGAAYYVITALLFVVLWQLFDYWTSIDFTNVPSVIMTALAHLMVMAGFGILYKLASEIKG